MIAETGRAPSLDALAAGFVFFCLNEKRKSKDGGWGIMVILVIFFMWLVVMAVTRP